MGFSFSSFIRNPGREIEQSITQPIKREIIQPIVSTYETIEDQTKTNLKEFGQDTGLDRNIFDSAAKGIHTGYDSLEHGISGTVDWLEDGWEQVKDFVSLENAMDSSGFTQVLSAYQEVLTPDAELPSVSLMDPFEEEMAEAKGVKGARRSSTLGKEDLLAFMESNSVTMTAGDFSQGSGTVF